MASSWAETRGRERIERLCRSGLDAHALRPQVLTELGRAVGFDAYVWPLTDPVTATGAAPLADVPCLAELSTLIKLKYLSRVNRWTALAGQPGRVGLLRQVTNRDLARSVTWRGLLRRYEIADVASVAFADRYGCWSFLDLWRDGGRSFSDDDASFLSAITAPVTAALRAGQAATFADQVADRVHATGPAVLVLDDALRVVSQTAAAKEYLRLLLPSAAEGPPIPAVAYNVAAQLLATEHSADNHEPSTRVHLTNGAWVTVSAARLDAAPAGGSIVVNIQEISPADRLDIFARSFGLTARERQLLTLLATGADTRELARRMYLSEHTVQDHCKSVFAKTSVGSRRELLSKAVGNPNP